MPNERLQTREQELPGLLLREHRLEVPLDHARPQAESLEVFAREVVRRDKRDDKLPYLLFLQGGPGFSSPRPQDSSGWLGRALEQYRVVLLDQRGTGRSAPQSCAGLTQLGDAQAQLDWIVNFRADSIVRDAELLRVALQGEAGKWTLLGQSYGGFCSVHYLSSAPQSLDAALITGGLPGLRASADEVYRHTYAQQARKNAEYYRRYPCDVERAREVAGYLSEHEVFTSAGSRVSVRGLQQIGISFGQSGGFETVHYLLEEAFEDRAHTRLGHGFLRALQNHLSFDTNPIYALLHEMCYTQAAASNWSAERLRAEFPAYDASAPAPLYFTGEMIYPWMFDEDVTLRPVAELAELLARKSDWPQLYDPRVLAANEVPVAAAVYHDDAYVPRQLSLETADAIPNLRPWITNEYEHNGLRADGARILSKLLELADLG